MKNLIAPVTVEVRAESEVEAIKKALEILGGGRTMKTFTVPVFLGVRAETKTEAIEKVLEFLEYSLVAEHGDEVFPYCDIGLEHEVIEQVD